LRARRRGRSALRPDGRPRAAHLRDVPRGLGLPGPAGSGVAVLPAVGEQTV